MQKQDQPDQDRFSLNNENDQQIDAMQKQTRRLRNIFLGLWLGTLIAVIFCLVLGFLLFFNAVGSILILTSLVLTPINITFFVLYLVNATKAKS